MAGSDPVKVGGAYVEDEDHVPNPTDMVSQYNTEGVGAHHRIEEVSHVFEVDKVRTAQDALAALDPKDDSVPASRVVLPDANVDNETARKDLTEAAKARVKRGVEIGGPTPAQREAEEKGTKGAQQAVKQEARNATANSATSRSAGQHSGDKTSTEAAEKKDETKKS